MILFGHPTGNPNSHHAALAHYETGRLEAFVLPWFPSRSALAVLRAFPPARTMAGRLERRRFEPLANAPKIQGRLGEFKRLVIRAFGKGDEGLSYEANDWLMRTMARESVRPSVTAVHSYEDASLWSFQQAKKLGKACIYDMPIGYYPAWEQSQAELARVYADWLPAGGLTSSKWVRPEQKREEMQLADLVFVPSRFARRSITDFIDKQVALAIYGVDSNFWRPSTKEKKEGPLRFIYAGQLSIRKGIPVLLEAWKRANIKDAELELTGSWLLSNDKRSALPAGVRHLPPCSADELRRRYQSADVFIFPSFFEGFGLVLLEAMACGLPIISSERTAAPDFVSAENGSVVPAGDLEAWISALVTAAENRDRLPVMKSAARKTAVEHAWSRYRQAVSNAVGELLS
jgi:alpha-maltose-1-phosphate synthase